MQAYYRNEKINEYTYKLFYACANIITLLLLLRRLTLIKTKTKKKTRVKLIYKHTKSNKLYSLYKNIRNFIFIIINKYFIKIKKLIKLIDLNLIMQDALLKKFK